MVFRPDRLALLAALAALLVVAPAGAVPPTVDAAGVALHAGNASNAVALATQALADPSLTPRDRARVLIDRGLAHEMLGEHDAATIDFTEAINAHALMAADQRRALYDRGVALDAGGQTQDAIGDYSAAIRLDPRHAAALNNRGNAYRRLGRFDDAAADYKRSLAAGNPHAEYPNYGLGQVAEARGNVALARTYYKAALAANSQFALARERLTALATAPAQALPPAPAASPPPSNPAAPLSPAASDDSGPVVLHPPGSAPPPADDGVIHLRPPSRVVHLHPPRPPKPAVAAPELKPALGVTGGHGETIQLGAWRNEADAADAWNNIVAIAGTAMAGLSPQVVPADLPGRGRYYRLRAGPVYDGAARLCAALIARKLSCMVVPR
ncbi:MAG: tetratricopeptide repeat protein [Alphaproteobacteria bacterium]|nr:tetratricopeptide repeat protein [Alphaproteobacteria bacterium]MBL7097205.1 tetratricopeptide repeat protein [Alphaproteobacteria bacterium]